MIKQKLSSIAMSLAEVIISILLLTDPIEFPSNIYNLNIC